MTRRSSRSTGRSVHRSAGIAVALTLAAALPSALTAGAQAPTTCAAPYLPVYGFDSLRSGTSASQTWPAERVESPSFAGPRLSLQDALVDAGTDLDGDGRPDDIRIDSVDGRQVLVVRTAAGEVRVGQPGMQLGSLDNTPVGDLDGDGRDELLFLARSDDGTSDDYYVLPGGTAPGNHRPADVAIKIPSYQVLPGGAWLGGPGQDLVVGSWDGTSASTAVVDGHAVMAAGPGGSSDLPAASDPVPGYPGGTFDLGNGRVAIAAVVATPNTGGTIEVHLHERSGAVQRFASPAALPYPIVPLTVDVVVDGERRLLTAVHGDRGGSTGFAWDIDEPCRPLPAVGGSTTPTSPPAAPRPGAATYTG